MSWKYTPRCPTFEVGGRKFALTTQDDETERMCVVLLMWNNDQWEGFSDGDLSTDSFIATRITDETIMAHGSLHAFLQWCIDEATKIAHHHVFGDVPPLPDPHNRIERMVYNMTESIKVVDNKLVLSPASLP